MTDVKQADTKAPDEKVSESTELVNANDVVNTATIADRLGVTEATVAMWVKKEGNGFPEPLPLSAAVGRKVYSFSAVQQWRETTKVSKVRARVERLRKELAEAEELLSKVG